MQEALEPVAKRMLFALAGTKFLLHLVTIRGYGIFRDELYYLDCAKHLAWGYVDQPPLIAVVAFLTSLLGDSILAIRLPAALAGAALLLLTGFLAREMGGGRFAQALSALAVLAAPGFLFIHHVLTMNAFEPLFWTGAAFLVARILRTGGRRLWLAFGLLFGLGLLNKHSMIFFGFGLAMALLLDRQSRIFRERWIWLGALLAILVFLPHLVWQIQHGFPQLEILRTTRAHRDVRLSPLAFWGAQVFFLNPLSLPIWLGGLWFFFTSRGRTYRVLGWTFLVIAATLMLLRAKFYYLGPAFPVLFAGGSVWLEGLLAARGRRWAKPVLAAGLPAAGAVLAPLMLPLLPVETYLRYARRIGISEVKTERHERGRLPQHYADMFGWENMAAQVARVYRGLSPEERARAAIAAQNFGEAGAINYFGPRYRLPRAFSGHNSYFLWGPGEAVDADVFIVVGDRREILEKIFARVEQAGLITHEYAIPYETNLPIWVCRQPRVSLRDAWPGIRHYD